MASAHPLAKHWAVLVGINFYGGAEDVKGCVHHVWAMKQYLQTDIAALTATAPANPTSRRRLQLGRRRRDPLFRDAAVCPDQWLVAPDGYTILAACGPHEIAREVQLAQGERRVSVRLAASAHKLLNHIQQTRGSDGQRWLRLCTKDEQEACMFNLAVNDRHKYEILDGTLQRIRSLPTVPIDTPDAEHHVLATLQHLAEFKYADGIENRLPNSSLEAPFSLLSSADGKAPDTWAVHNIEHGGRWRLALDTHRRLDKTLARAKLPGTGNMGNSELHHTHRDARERLKTGYFIFQLASTRPINCGANVHCTCYGQLDCPRLAKAGQNGYKTTRSENDNDQSGCQAADKMANDDRGEEENGDEWCKKNSHRSSYR
ncbi:hypothetical protein MHUMG1_09326 [Metarhizium humberi]|uniref:Uncharacterized protein n=1 Tax=Metarhizium humberi TaxID=2596975 RepID=A0A9P8M2S0_9HYPO|nr:hypothetical protein MHUMG1_09326 [Metarhizium humberi]